MSDVSIWRQKRCSADGQRLSQWAWVPRPHLRVPIGRRPLYRGLLTAISDRSWSKYLKWKDICAYFRLTYKIKVKVEKFNLKCTNEILKAFDELVSGRIPNINFGTCYRDSEIFFPQLNNCRQTGFCWSFSKEKEKRKKASFMSLRRNLEVLLKLDYFIASIVKSVKKCTTFKTCRLWF